VFEKLFVLDNVDLYLRVLEVCFMLGIKINLHKCLKFLMFVFECLTYTLFLKATSHELYEKAIRKRDDKDLVDLETILSFSCQSRTLR
jgi:hypothetical protein